MPSASGGLVEVVVAVSWVWSGDVVELADHSIEYPETPLAASVAPLHATTTARSEDQSDGCALESAGFPGAGGARGNAHAAFRAAGRGGT